MNQPENANANAKSSRGNPVSEHKFLEDGMGGAVSCKTLVSDRYVNNHYDHSTAISNVTPITTERMSKVTEKTDLGSKVVCWVVSPFFNKTKK